MTAQGKKKNRLPLSEETIHIVIAVHECFKDVTKTVIWLNTRNLNFGGAKPIWLMQQDRGHKVLEFINAVKQE